MLCCHNSDWRWLLISVAAKDKSEKIFALAFVKLMRYDGTTLRDGEHDLIVYKVDRVRAQGAEAGCSSFLGRWPERTFLPSRRKRLPRDIPYANPCFQRPASLLLLMGDDVQ